MHSFRGGVLFAAGLIVNLLSFGAVRAENPKFSLKLENATVEEIAAALGRASGVPVTVFRPPSGKGVPVPGPAARYSFDWKEVSLGRALRQFERKAHLFSRFNVDDTRWVTLYPAKENPAAVDLRIGEVTMEGIRLTVESVRRLDTRVAVLDAGGVLLRQQAGREGTLSITLRVDGDDLDAERLASMENVQATDDRRQRLLGRGTRAGRLAFALVRPDESVLSATLAPPSPRARSLAVLEGDLFVYRQIDRRKVELPWPSPGRSVRKVSGDWWLGVEAIDARNDSVFRLGGLPEELAQFGRGSRLPEQFPHIRVRASWPTGVPDRSTGSVAAPPVAIDRAGNEHFPVTAGENYSAAGTEERRIHTSVWAYPTLSAPAERLVFRIADRSRPERLVHFRMVDIPLPLPGAIGPAANFDDAVSEESRWSLRDPQGGALSSKVLLQPGEDRRGLLRVGLAALDGARQSPVEWTTVPVGPSGNALVREVRPGRYRVFRAFQVPYAESFGRAPTTGVTASGEWRNTETVVGVMAGRTLALPPLLWVSTAGEEGER